MTAPVAQFENRLSSTTDAAHAHDHGDGHTGHSHDQAAQEHGHTHEHMEHAGECSLSSVSVSGT
jgi:urease accessory protein